MELNSAIFPLLTTANGINNEIHLKDISFNTVRYNLNQERSSFEIKFIKKLLKMDSHFSSYPLETNWSSWVLVYGIKNAFAYHPMKGESLLLNTLKYIEFDPELLEFLCNVLYEHSKNELF